MKQRQARETIFQTRKLKRTKGVHILEGKAIGDKVCNPASKTEVAKWSRLGGKKESRNRKKWFCNTWEESTA